MRAPSRRPPRSHAPALLRAPTPAPAGGWCEQALHLRAQVAGGLPEPVGVVGTVGAVVEDRRHVHVQAPAGAGEGDVEQAPLLRHALLRGGAHVGGEVAVVGADHVHRLPLQALGRVDRAEHEVVLVEVGPSRQCRARGGRIDRQLGHEAAQLRGRPRRRRQRLEVPHPDRPVVVAQADQRRDRLAQPLHARARGRLRLRAGTAQGPEQARGVGAGALRHLLARGPPVLAALRGARRGARRPVRGVLAAQRLQDPPRACRADAVQQLQHAKPGELVGRVVHQPQQREQVLDVRGIEVAEPSVLDERDPAAGELELQQGRVVSGAEQDRLGAQLDRLLARGQHPLAHLPRLCAFVVGEHELGPDRSLAVAPQPPRKPALVLGRDGVGDVEDLLRGAVVALEQHRAGVREHVGEAEDVTGARRAEAVDRLEVVADHAEAPSPAMQLPDDVHLQRVDVLVLVHEHVLEAAGDRPGGPLLAHQRPPPEQQVVEVEQSQLALAGGVGAEHLRQQLGVLLAPGEPARRGCRAAAAGR